MEGHRSPVSGAWWGGKREGGQPGRGRSVWRSQGLPQAPPIAQNNMNLMKVDGYHAKIEYDEETDQFRGEILGISGGADFYGSSPDELRREFQKSLEVFLEVCKEQGIEPRRSFSGRFNLRISPELHEKLAMTAEIQGKSLNTLAQVALQRSVTA